MHFPRILITLLALIAHAHCGTLRQYSRDWLIPKPEPQVGSKRITAKSVFITPNFQQVRCATGYEEDSSGRCVKLVHVNQEAQLDFLLQRLNSMYGAPAGNSDKQPLQVEVSIPVEPTDPDLVAETTAPHINIPLPTTEEAPTATEEAPTVTEEALIVHLFNQSDKNISKEQEKPEESLKPGADDTYINSSGVYDVTNQTSFDSQTESGNITSLDYKPSEYPVYLEEEPYVSLTVINSGDEPAATNDSSSDDDGNYVAVDHFMDKIPSRNPGIMVDMRFDNNVNNNTTKIKKGSASHTDVSAFSVNVSSNTDHGLFSNETLIGTSDHKVNTNTTVSNQHANGNENDHHVFTSFFPDDMLDEENSVSENTFQTKHPNGTSDKSTNNILGNNSVLEEVTSLYTSYDSSNEDEVTMLPTTLETTTVLPVTVKTGQFVEKGSFEHGGSGDENPDMGVDLEVDYLFNHEHSVSGEVHVNKSVEHVSEVSVEESVGGNPGESDSDSQESDTGNTGVRVHEKDCVKSVDCNGSVGMKEDMEFSDTHTKKNGPNEEKVYSVTQKVISNVNTDEKPFKIDLGFIDYSKPNVEISSGSTEEGSDDLTLEDVTPLIVLDDEQSTPEQSEHQQNIHVVHSKPIVQTSFNQKPQSQTTIKPIFNLNLKDTVDFKPSPLQIHNLNTQHQTPIYIEPLVEKVPDSSQKYGGFPYPPLPPLPENPPRPHYQPPQEHQSQINPNHNGFVRFPVDTPPYRHRHRPDEEANTVRFPQDDGRFNDKYSRWGTQYNSNWRFQDRRQQRPEQRFWQGRQEAQNPPVTTMRIYWEGNRPNRRRQRPNYQ